MRLNPYRFACWNPIKFTDLEGRRIVGPGDDDAPSDSVQGRIGGYPPVTCVVAAVGMMARRDEAYNVVTRDCYSKWLVARCGGQAQTVREKGSIAN